MSQPLNPMSFPLHGSRLIEASAGTGKTWTIAALYLRLVLGHGSESAFCRPLLPSEILVMTFTRAATKELSNRIRERLVEAANCFRGAEAKDDYLRDLIDEYPEGEVRNKAAYRLMLAAESMDEAAVFTIDSWCQRMLREHAFDSGSLFDEELATDQSVLTEHAVRDYWRQQIYPLSSDALNVFRNSWPDVFSLENAVNGLIKNAPAFGTFSDEKLLDLIDRINGEQMAQAITMKQGWPERIDRMENWLNEQRSAAPNGFSGTKLPPEKVTQWFSVMREWAGTPEMLQLDLPDKAWEYLNKKGIASACNKNFKVIVPDDFDAMPMLLLALGKIEPISTAMLRHAVGSIFNRIEELKLSQHQIGFADLLTRLKRALEGDNGQVLRNRIVAQYPVALIDEFQDTSPDQYAIFNALYHIAENSPETGVFLIGDPKQSVYAFRGADIYSYLAARRATNGRHYLLSTNFRSTSELVGAINTVFEFAESKADDTGFPGGAFKFRNGQGNELPFDAVQANGRKETLVDPSGAIKAMTFLCHEEPGMTGAAYRDYFSQHCAETIVQLLNDAKVGFQSAAGFVQLQPADIAILVRDRHEAAAIRKALQRRKVASVYLSDRDSVIKSAEASDVLRWLRAVSNPADSNVARSAYATNMAGLSLNQLAMLASDDREWEVCVEQLKSLHLVWQRQGVLAMLRSLIHELDLPARLLNQPGGERALTNLLHLAEIVQTASGNLDGEQSLIRWLTEQILHEDGDAEERILRLESDAELVKVCTVHKSKGLEYPLVFIPFAVSAKAAPKKGKSFYDYVDEHGGKKIALSLSNEVKDAIMKGRLEEDLRLLYVALTRARHAVWLGVASLKEKIENSALGYLINGGTTVPAAALRARLEDVQENCHSMQVTVIAGDAGSTPLARKDNQPELVDAPTYVHPFENDWTVGSFSSLTRSMVATAVPVKMLDNNEPAQEGSSTAIPTPTASDAVWHRFPRGSRPGQFLHEQLEWMGNEGFSIVDNELFEARFNARCERVGWENRQEEALAWLSKVAATKLLPINRSLKELDTSLPEMEFWFSSERLATRELDQFCKKHLLAGVARADIPERDLHGLLMGFADLVFEHDGKYWVLDYKSNFIGSDDASYHRQALQTAMAAHRYDIQGAIYMLALHRLLKNRLGPSYSPETHLGGAIFFFLRGIENPETRGCHCLEATTALMDGLDQLFTEVAVS